MAPETTRNNQGSQERKIESPQTWPLCLRGWSRWSGNWLSYMRPHLEVPAIGTSAASTYVLCER